MCPNLFSCGSGPRAYAAPPPRHHHPKHGNRTLADAKALVRTRRAAKARREATSWIPADPLDSFAKRYRSRPLRRGGNDNDAPRTARLVERCRHDKSRRPRGPGQLPWRLRLSPGGLRFWGRRGLDHPLVRRVLMKTPKHKDGLAGEARMARERNAHSCTEALDSYVVCLHLRNQLRCRISLSCTSQ